MSNDNSIYSRTLWDAAAFTDTTAQTVNIPLKDYNPNGFFTIYVDVGTGGDLKLEWLCSVNGSEYLIPKDKNGNTIPDIVTAQGTGTST